MKKKTVFLLIFVCSMCAGVSCSPWPRLYIGDCSGIATYDRNSRRFEIMWERHTKIVGDSCQHESSPDIQDIKDK